MTWSAFGQAMMADGTVAWMYAQQRCKTCVCW